MKKGKTVKLTICISGIAFLAGCLFMGRLMSQSVDEENNSAGVSMHGALHVEGSSLLDEEGKPVVLRGISSHGIMWYPRYLNGRAMEYLAERGANVQRLAMYTEAYKGYLEYPQENLSYLYLGIETALAADMYVIVDWHILNDGNPNTHVEEAKKFFEEISLHYSNHSKILYEICNEPNGDTTWEDVAEYAKQVIPVIRKNAPDSVVLVGLPNYCTDISGPIHEPLPYENVMYVLHKYVDMFVQKEADFYLLSQAVESGLPIFVSEWGMAHTEEKYFEPGTDLSKVVIYPENAGSFLDYMNENNISWCAWALSNKNEVHGMFKQDSHKYSDWSEEDLTEYGRWVLDNLR